MDGSTGLAHLYESDKAQPGRPWYDRSIIFTDLLCQHFGNITREQLGQEIDQLFRASLHELMETRGAQVDTDRFDSIAADYPADNETSDVANPAIKYIENNTPEAYTPDVDLVTEFSSLLIARGGLTRSRATPLAKGLVARARFYYTVDRKRQNVLGEGFEDLLQLLLMEVGQIPESVIAIRRRANTLPGFTNPGQRDRIEAPDIAIIRDDRTELLASVKWSLRHDRQKQLSDELDCYVDLLSQDSFPRYVLVTNEYDPGRLVNADGLARRGQKIDCIYHTNLDLLLQVLDDHDRVKDLRPLIVSGRLRSVGDFLRNPYSG